MGYNSTVYGRIEIRPALHWGSVRNSRFLPGLARHDQREVEYEIVETVEETDEGTITRKRAVAVVPAWEDSYKAYNLLEHLSEINAEVVAAGSTLHGFLVREGEEQGDVERYGIGSLTNTVFTEKAHLSWPDGTAVHE